MPWSREKIVTKIRAAVDQYPGGLNPQQFKQLQLALVRVPKEDVFESLYSIFLDESRPEKRFQDQSYAGKLLLAEKPPCFREPLCAIRDVLGNWDVSIEELPWYFAALYGTQSVCRMLVQLALEQLTHEQRNDLITFGWWLGGQEFSSTLRNKAQPSPAGGGAAE
jgi:hypothetical protein